jgi:hypothetical protein
MASLGCGNLVAEYAQDYHTAIFRREVIAAVSTSGSSFIEARQFAVDSARSSVRWSTRLTRFANPVRLNQM